MPCGAHRSWDQASPTESATQTGENYRHLDVAVLAAQPEKAVPSARSADTPRARAAHGPAGVGPRGQGGRQIAGNTAAQCGRGGWFPGGDEHTDRARLRARQPLPPVWLTPWASTTDLIYSNSVLRRCRHQGGCTQHPENASFFRGSPRGWVSRSRQARGYIFHVRALRKALASCPCLPVFGTSGRGHFRIHVMTITPAGRGKGRKRPVAKTGGRRGKSSGWRITPSPVPPLTGPRWWPSSMCRRPAKRSRHELGTGMAISSNCASTGRRKGPGR